MVHLPVFHPGPPDPTPEQRLFLMNDEDWEVFIEECARQLMSEGQYEQVHRLGGAGDRGRDVCGYLQTHAEEFAVLKAQRAEIDAVNQVNATRISALREAQDRFHLLDEKYENDFQRLQAISTAAAIVGSFEARACPLCRTDISHQARHTDEQENRLALRKASQAESLKIVALLFTEFVGVGEATGRSGFFPTVH